MSDLYDIVVTDTYRSFDSIKYGAYGSFARGFGVSDMVNQEEKVKRLIKSPSCLLENQ